MECGSGIVYSQRDLLDYSPLACDGQAVVATSSSRSRSPRLSPSGQAPKPTLVERDAARKYNGASGAPWPDGLPRDSGSDVPDRHERGGHGRTLAQEARPLVSPSLVKVLFLTPRVPYPLDAGTSLRNFRLLQSAAREHEVHLFSFQDRPLRPDHLEALQAVCRRVELRPAPPHPAIQRLTRTLTS